MIPLAPGGGGAGGAVPFPDPPKGDPGAIDGCANTLKRAAGELEHAETGLHGANGSLQSDWQGFAAQAYHAASTGLAAVARGGAETFRECASAVSRYGADLDHVQSELRGLKQLYDDALRRQAAANGLAGKLQTALGATTKPSEVSKLGTQIGNAQQQALDAGNEANGYARRAQDLVNGFKGKAQGYAATLSGQQPGHLGPLGSPFSAPGTPGPGFGIPDPGGLFGGVNPDGLDPYRGVIPVGDPWNSYIPGYGYYMDATHGNATSPGDLTDLITFLAGGLAAGPLKDLGERALSTIAGGLGYGSAAAEGLSEAQIREATNALDELVASGAARGSTPLRDLAPTAINDGRSLGAAKYAVDLHEVRATLSDVLVKIADSKVPLPAGASDIASELMHRGWVYSSYALARLGQLQHMLEASGSPAARAAASTIGTILRASAR
jgi:uncharacterized protein YukE